MEKPFSAAQNSRRLFYRERPAKLTLTGYLVTFTIIDIHLITYISGDQCSNQQKCNSNKLKRNESGLVEK